MSHLVGVTSSKSQMLYRLNWANFLEPTLIRPSYLARRRFMRVMAVHGLLHLNLSLHLPRYLSHHRFQNAFAIRAAPWDYHSQGNNRGPSIFDSDVSHLVF